MKALFGAWGIGAIASQQSDAWNKRINIGVFDKFTIPPLSSTHPGFIETSPLLFFDKIYLEALQYELITEQVDLGYYIAPNNSEIINEFVGQGFIEPVSFSSIARKNAKEIIELAETILLSDEIIHLYKESSKLWKDFVISRGGLSLPNRAKEIMIIESSSKQLRELSRLDVASICSHDVFDVATMAIIAKKLDAVICDWQMYRPYYNFLNKSNSAFRYFRFPNMQSQLSIDYLIPVPKEINTSNLMSLRESRYLESMKRNEKIDIKLNAPTSRDLFEIRRNLSYKNDIEFATIRRTVNKRKGDTFIEVPKIAVKEDVFSHPGIDRDNQKLLIMRTKELIGENKLSEVIDNLRYITAGTTIFEEEVNELILLKRRLKSNEFDNRNSLKLTSELMVEYNAISYSLIQVCDKIVYKLG